MAKHSTIWDVFQEWGWGGQGGRSRTQPIFQHGLRCHLVWVWSSSSFFFFNIKDICGRFHMGFMDCGGNVPSVRQHFNARPNTLRKVWLKLRGGVINPHRTLTQSHSSSFYVKFFFMFFVVFFANSSPNNNSRTFWFNKKEVVLVPLLDGSLPTQRCLCSARWRFVTAEILPADSKH